jgi:endonuclease/exonuclease/phosphatase family metal-dependent hydrolase
MNFRRLSAILFFALMLFLIAACNEKDLNLTVMSYNIMFDFPDKDYDTWKVRKVYEAQIIKDHNPDLIGIQEPFQWQINDLKVLCPEYASISIPVHTDSTILYKKDKFTVMMKGSYWLSPTPQIPLSSGFGNFLPRYVIWAKLYENETKREFYFINTHFDNTSPFQEKAAPLFLERTATKAVDLPVVITGDFNSVIGSKAFDILTDNASEFFLKDAYQIANTHEIYNCQGECNDSTHTGEGQIDHVFLAGADITCSVWGVDKLEYGDPPKAPADHFSVIAKIKIPADKIEKQ